MKLVFKRLVTWLCTVAILLGLLPGTLSQSYAETAPSNGPIWPNPGAINLTKKAEPTSIKDEWKVTLTAEGKNLKIGSDVVIVIDRSGSMEGTRMDNAKKAANKFVDLLLGKGSISNVAVVSFSGNVEDVSGFVGASGAEGLKKQINKIEAEGGTNIQAGIKRANELLSKSSAKNKAIVLLSDGEPTYSYQASKAADYTQWIGSKHNFILSNFNYKNKIGTGKSYSTSGYSIIKKPGYWDNSGWWPVWVPDEKYEIKDHGIGTISEAKMVKDSKIKIYTVGLEVNGNEDATYVLKNVQSDGYYPSNSSELDKVFTELAGKSVYAAADAVVVDPMGEFFNLKLQGKELTASDYTTSQGTLVWDASKETFTWKVGNIIEGAPAQLTYTVKMDPKKNPESGKLYPTNGTTTITYNDATVTQTKKEFEVPKVSIGKGSILVKGYKVNADGKPVNETGEPVESPDKAHEVYSESFKPNGQEALDLSKTYTVPAPSVKGYTFKEGKNPTEVELTSTNPSKIVWFGFTANPVIKTVTVKYLEIGTNKELQKPTTESAEAGKTIELKAPAIDGYIAENPTVSITVGSVSEHIFYYKAKEKDKGTVTVNYLEAGTNKKLMEPTTVTDEVGKMVELVAPGIEGYVAQEPTHNFTIGTGSEHTFFYKAKEKDKGTVTVNYLEAGTNKKLMNPTTVTDEVGKVIELVAPGIEGYVAQEPTHNLTIGTGSEHTFFYKAKEKDKGTVTVNYLEAGTNKKLMEPTTVTDEVGKVIELVAPEIEGYVAQEPTHNFTIGTGSEHTFFYKAKEKDKGTVTVNYLEAGTNKKLMDPTKVTDEVGKVIELVAPGIEGYVAQEPTHNFTIGAGSEYTFFYKAKEKDKGTVTVNYLEAGTNKKLMEPTTVTDEVGKVIELVAPAIEGFVAQEPTHNFTIGAGSEYTFFYKTKEKDKGTVTVNYLEAGTNKKLMEPTTVTDEVGKVIELVAPTIEGYVAQEPTHNFTIGAGSEHTFFYKAKEPTIKYATVIVKFLEEGTNKSLSLSIPVEDQVGKRIELKAVAIDGYTPIQLSASYLITDVENQEYPFYYTANKTVTRNVTVKYLESGTNEKLAEQTQVPGEVGKSIPLTAKQITGYTPKTPSNSYPVTDSEQQEFIFFYTKNVVVPVTHKVTVKYLESGTNIELATSTQVSGEVGKPFTLIAPSISGYTATQASATYVVTDKDQQSYTFFYTKNQTRPDPDPDRGNGNGNGNNTVTPLPPVPVLPPLPPLPPKLEKDLHADYVTGYPDGTIRPENNISREEVATIFYRLMEDNSRKEYFSTKQSFTDVESARWSNKFIATMSNAGVISGYPGGIFKPGTQITRAEFATIASKFDKLDERDNDSFTDITGHWAEKYIASAANKGWIKGYDDKTFKPDQYITRAEAMAFINSVLNRKVKNEGIHQNAKKWPDNLVDKWYYRDVQEATNNHDYTRDNDSEVWKEIKPDRIYP
ncbi:MucBP domain-containing protein [Paenibacillus sp. KN14-4R]|uniref:MucBP domain-containing protein n=1 Tax=Paenibacillus sp. KN14-4R TaxID=3445773 RepID=UPI003FA055DD